MPTEPFPPGGPGGEEPEGSSPRPERGNGAQDVLPAEGPGQGLFVCVPAGPADLSRFATGEAGAVEAGPVLAGVAAALVDSDGLGLARTSKECLYAVMSAGRRMASWGTWLEFSAMRELAVRHPAVPDRRGRPNRPATSGQPPAQDQPAPQHPPTTPGPTAAQKPDGTGTAGTPAGTGAASAAPAADDQIQFSEFLADEVAGELRLTWMSAADRMSYACALAERLPVTFAALGAGLIDPVHAKIIYEQTIYLSVADAARADPVLAAAAQVKTYGELRAAAVKLTLTLDPESAERRKQARRKEEAHVRPFREESGNAGMTARELPSDEVLASWQHVEQRALELRAARMPGTLRELRVRAYLDLLQERDSRLVAGSAPDQGQRPAEGPDGPQGETGRNGGSGPRPDGGPAGTGPDGHARPSAKDSGPCLAALVNITMPLATILGESGTPGEAAGFGLLDAGTARDLIAAAARSPHTRWCVTALHPDGTAAAHGCAPGRSPAPPGPEPPGPEPPRPGTTRPGISHTIGHSQSRHHLRHQRRAGSATPARHPGPGVPTQPARPAHPDRPWVLRPSARRERVSAQPQTPAPDPGAEHPVQRTGMRAPGGPVRPGSHRGVGRGGDHVRVRVGPAVPAPSQV